MQLRTGKTEDEINAAIKIDARVTGTSCRAKYITTVAERGGLKLACERGQIVGFCCLDHGYFLEKPFISLLIVDGEARRLGFGEKLLQSVACDYAEIWTSTNRSNSEMRGLLEKAGWQFCGELDGLDFGDPELFFKKSG